MGTWGVDSNEVVTTAFITDVTTMGGRAPTFWGRYVGGNTRVGTPLSKPEVALLHQHGLRVLLIYNNLLAHEPAGDSESGQMHAGRAVTFVTQLGAPTDGSLCIYADLENWQTSGDWIDGWIAGIQSGGFLPGFYASLSLPSFAAAYCDTYARHPERLANVLLYGNQPSARPTTTNVKAGFKADVSPNVPSCRPNSGAIWQYVLSALNDRVDIDVAAASAFSAMWS